ncbi:glycosyltransferase family 4 protein [Clostridium tetani]|uniref:glycosyltransferase n=1 Tax=Clostridium tetani TaxID=1513 RepID=UPI00100A9DDB|nr:glycosyltransferase [Clostridium tetani]RXM77061.1 glycosyltransferase family 4 protein [Clostridium tetani]RYU99305.1 glycosyltransferase family 4 protein [Clostridium tetani]
MKVLIISHMYPSTFNSMAGIFVHQQVKALKEKGLDVKVISPVPLVPFPLNLISEKWARYKEIPYKTNIQGVEVYYPRYLEFPKGIMFHKSGIFMSMGIKRLIKKVYKDFKFDVIHSHVAVPDGYAGMILNKEFKVAHVVTIHGQDFQNTINKNIKCKKALFNVLNHVDKIITVSNKLKNVVKNEKFYNKMEIVNNGIDKDYIDLNKIHENCSGQNRVNKNLIKILSVSNLKETKGIHINLKAVSKLKEIYPDISYDIIGDGEYKSRLEELVKELCLEDNVSFLGKLEHKEVINIMKQYDIFSLPSYKEGFGMVYIEAMSKGVPVIGVKGEGIEDAIENGINGFLVERKNVDELVKTIDFLIKNPKKRMNIGKCAIKTVSDKFTWNVNADKIISIYNKVILK